MNAQSDVVAADDDDFELPWLPDRWTGLRLAGVHFDAIRIDGPRGRVVADQLASITTGGPGPVILAYGGKRATYFLVPVGSTGHRAWPPGVARLTGPVACERRRYFIGVPALRGSTWPLTWHSRPTPDGRLVNVSLLHAVVRAVWAASE
ncbi:hypothetical protein [Streptomyces millisiae]|uniref:DNA primase/polymerase bifunctional N-terminal domain-containing protein n=1 Tax=Streptomyces millisiae TaxID=3075542 RepID=A0ABU2LQ14_9ACTN|nr:hypothetical protein [Streptomyces sp. DSM 44918]MDT0319680.1 hypothetical protein [Streptomyces sp. DSM 44918]